MSLCWIQMSLLLIFYADIHSKIEYDIKQIRTAIDKRFWKP